MQMHTSSFHCLWRAKKQLPSHVETPDGGNFTHSYLGPCFSGREVRRQVTSSFLGWHLRQLAHTWRSRPSDALATSGICPNAEMHVIRFVELKTRKSEVGGATGFPVALFVLWTKGPTKLPGLLWLANASKSWAKTSYVRE